MTSKKVNDLDPQETLEWIEAIEAVVERAGLERLKKEKVRLQADLSKKRRFHEEISGHIENEKQRDRKRGQ